MKNKKIIFGLFVVLACVQLYAVASMILETESILKEGTSIKLRLRPIDPTDPFRGKYIILNYEDTELNINSTNYWEDHTEAYLSFYEDSLGFSKPYRLSVDPPQDNLYLKVDIGQLSWKRNQHIIHITYPQERFYMEESKAKPAEDLVRKALNDNKTCYVELKILDGKSAIENVYIGNIPLIEALKNH